MAALFDYNIYSYQYPSFGTYSSFSWNNYDYYPSWQSYPLFGNWSLPSFYTPSYYSFDKPLFSFGTKSYSVKSFEIPDLKTFEAPSQKGTGTYSFGKTVTPGRIGRSKRPSFKTAEAARLYDPFMNKAKAFNPKTDLGPEFLAKVKKVAKKIDCDYKDLLAVMQAESGLNPYIPNQAGYGAYGLIQFQPDTLRGLGSSPEKLLAMSPIEQLDLVEKHFLTNKKAMKLKGHLTSGEVYGLVLAPGYVKNSYFYKAGSSGYNANRALDTVYGDGNGKIEKSDLVAYMNAKRVNENIFVA